MALERVLHCRLHDSNAKTTGSDDRCDRLSK
jgi:hypothetical protein